jgi:hypothetical protein
VSRVQSGAPISVGIDHPNYNFEVSPLNQAQRDSLARDLQGQAH